ncbi:MAG: hypothetical protein WCF85_20240 [Rhodospirillaceae bacterium]
MDKDFDDGNIHPKSLMELWLISVALAEHRLISLDERDQVEAFLVKSGNFPYLDMWNRKEESDASCGKKVIALIDNLLSIRSGVLALAMEGFNKMKITDGHSIH